MATTDSLSDLLLNLAEGPPGRVSIGDMVDHFGPRAFGAMLFAFSVPNLLPLPPGSSTVLSLPLVLLAPQLALGLESPWLPRFAADKTIERHTLAKGFARLIPPLKRLERLLAPRFTLVFGPVGDRLIGLVCFALALVLILPIPLGNMAPAASIAALALGLTQRDGVLALVGYLLAAFSVGLLVLSAHAVTLAIRHLLQIFGV
jgi:hypothetical protein